LNLQASGVFYSAQEKMHLILCNAMSYNKWMKAIELIKICTAAIPQEVEWSKGELYGPYDVNPTSDIRKVLYCVTPTKQVVDYFQEGGYDILISHHPYKANRFHSGKYENVPQLIFHTALDCCEGGLNDMWKDFLGVKDAQHFDGTLGWYGKIDPLPFDQLVEKVRGFSGGVDGLVISEKKIIESVVICTGLGGMVFDIARNTGADCYITGQLTHTTKGIPAIIETGHTHSEAIGVLLFKRLLEPMGVIVEGAPKSIDIFGDEFMGNPNGEETNEKDTLGIY